jgi:hypothetical protein
VRGRFASSLRVIRAIEIFTPNEYTATETSSRYKRKSAECKPPR